MLNFIVIFMTKQVKNQRKFQLKIGLLKTINKIIFINFQEEKKKTTLLFVFSTYLLVFLLKFRSRELVGCGIKLCIQRVPTLHTFDGPCYPRNNKFLKKKKCDDDDQVFSGISCFLGSRVCQKYAELVLIGCGI